MDISLNVIHQWLSYQNLQGDLPGFQVSIRQGAKLIFNRAYGFANLSKKTKYTTSHLGRIASQSKTFVAALGLALEAQGILKLNDAVTTYVPELKAHKDIRARKLAIIDLLTNRAGIIRDSYELNYWVSDSPFPNQDELLAELLNAPLAKTAQPMKYSNMGFALAGLVFERAAGASLDDLVQKYLLSKIDGLQVFAKYKPRLKVAKGYIREQALGRKFKSTRRRDTRALTPAAGFWANTASTTRFFHHLYQSSEILLFKQRNKLLDIKTAVPKVESDHYGIGTIISHVNGSTYVGHSGGFPGFASQTWVVPRSRLTYGFCTNLSAIKTFNFIRGMHEITQTLEKVFSPHEASSLVVSEPIADNYGSTIYVVGKNRAVAFALSSLPTERVMLFKKYKGHFYGESATGYEAIHEPIVFHMKAKRIVAVQSGGFLARPLQKNKRF